MWTAAIHEGRSDSSPAPLASDAGPAMSMTSSVTACWSSVPLSFRTEEAGCGLPSAELATTRSAVSSRASSSFSSSTIRVETSGSSSNVPAPTETDPAHVLAWARTRFVAPTGATPTRSLPSRNFA